MLSEIELKFLMNITEFKVYCKRIKVNSKKENAFNMANHGLVQIIKGAHCYQLKLLFENGIPQTEFDVTKILY
jgi:hypothetical protein